MAKLSNVSSGYSRKAYTTFKINKNAIYLTNKFAKHADALDSYYD